MNDMNTSAELSVREIQAALDAGPTEGPWRGEELEARDGTFFPSFTAMPSGRFHHNPQTDADYIAAVNPTNMRKVLALLQSKEAEIARLKSEMYRFLPLLERVAEGPFWDELTAGLGIATINGYRAALKQPTE